jgi:hypothetical protein
MIKRDIALKILDYLIHTRNIITDEMALNYVALYPNWKVGKALSIGERIEYDGKLYKVVQAHTTQESWKPNLTPSLFEPIDVVNEGTLANPIIAAAGMCYFKDKYYLDETDNKIYLCIRDDSNGNGTVLHFMPNALVGTYFEVAA